jgi:zinc transporter ZupT
MPSWWQVFLFALGTAVATGLGALPFVVARSFPRRWLGPANALVLVPRGSSVWRAGWWSVFPSLPQPVMAVPAFMFVAVFEAWLPVGLGFAAGAMLWMVFSELIPEAVQDASPNAVAITATVALVAMQAFQIVLA